MKIKHFINQFSFLFLILLSILIPLLFGNSIDIYYKVEIYNLSHLIKTLLMFLLPFAFLPFIVKTITQVKAQSTYIIIAILVIVFLSNFISIMAAYSFGCFLIPLFGKKSLNTICNFQDNINTTYSIDLEPLLTIPQTLIASIIIGIIINYKSTLFLRNLMEVYRDYSRLFLQKIFINALPVYVFGTMLKMTHEIDFLSLLAVFGEAIFTLILTVTIYIFFLFFVSKQGNFKATVQSIKNSLPSGIMGFSTMSSLMTLPVTLKDIEKNTKNSRLSQMTVTTTVNFHDIGDCFSLPFMALTIYYIVNLSFPTFSIYVYFALCVALAQFSAVSVPNGSIAILLPILINHFNFTDEMASLLIMLSVLLEPFGTACNVIGNNVLAILIDNIYGKCERYK